MKLFERSMDRYEPRELLSPVDISEIVMAISEWFVRREIEDSYQVQAYASGVSLIIENLLKNIRVEIVFRKETFAEVSKINPTVRSILDHAITNYHDRREVIVPVVVPLVLGKTDAS